MGAIRRGGGLAGAAVRGSSRFGPVRDAALYPAPPPELALSLAKVRYAAYHDHCRAEERT